MIVLSLILDKHVGAYDADIYRVLTLKIKNPFLLMYAYPCTIGMVCNVTCKSNFKRQKHHFYRKNLQITS